MAAKMIDLVEVFPVRLSVEENDAGRVLIRGPFGHCAQPTSNGRLYKRDIMEREFKRLKESMKGRNLFGELDHPDDGRTSLKRVSHIITNLRIEKDGEVVGELEPLPTPMGQILKALAKAGCTLGVSSRGRGSVVTRDDGVDEVQDDFSLKTYDVVDNPASKNAFPSVVSESEVSAFLESIDESHREDVRAAFVEAAAKIDTFTLEDIKDEALRAIVARELNLSEAEDLNEASGFVVYNKAGMGKKGLHVANKGGGFGPLTSAADIKVWKTEAGAKRASKKFSGTTVTSYDAFIAMMESELDSAAAERDALKEALADKLVALKSELREEIEVDVRAALLMDPQVAAAKTVLESIITLVKPMLPLVSQADDKIRRENMALVDALKVRDFELATARMDREEALAHADAKLMEAHLKTRIAGHPKAGAIVKMIGPMNKLSGMDDLDTRIEAAFEAMGTPEDTSAEFEAEMSDKLESLRSQYADRIARLEEEVATYQKRLSDKTAKLKEAVQLGEQLEDARLEAEARADAAAVRLYAAEKTMGRPDAAKIMQMCESADSIEAVDGILRANRQKPEPDSMRDRIRRSVGRFDEEEVARPTGRAPRGNGKLNGESFQVDLDEAAALAGVSSARK
jgi:hypothetical protein